MLGHRQFFLDDYLSILRRRRWILIIPTIVGPIVAYLISLALPKQYTSQTMVLITQPAVPENVVRQVVTQDLDQRLVAMERQILSASRLEPMIKKFGLYAKDQGQVPMEDLDNRLRKAIEVTPELPHPENPSVLSGFIVKATDSDPRVAQQICSEVTSMFMQENLRAHQERTEDTTQFLSKEIEEAKAKLDEQESKLAAFKGHYIGGLPEDAQANWNILTELNTQLQATTQSLGRAQQDKAFTESMLSQHVAALQNSQLGRHPLTLERQLADLQDELVTLQARYTDDHPDVIKMKNDIAQLKKKIAEANEKKVAGANENEKKMAEPEEHVASEPDEKKELVSIAEPPEIQQLRLQLRQLDQSIRQGNKQEQDLEQRIKLYQGRVQLSPTVEQEYKQVTRDHETALEFYNDLLRKRSQYAMTHDLEQRQEGEQFSALDSASLPREPSFPDPRLFALEGLGVGLALGLGLAFVLEWIDTTLRTEGDVEVFLKVPTLALV
ncbi:MAG: Wzz/FepE/Etk N-terminal domain-containing protein, partial [Candidatus Acidiferrales bacterium]